jgi:NADPH-dependent curcumin reductase CurA
MIVGGAGSVAHYAIQFAKMRGARVVTTVSGPEKAAHALRARKSTARKPYSIPAAAKICLASGVARYVRNAFAASAEGALLISAAP